MAWQCHILQNYTEEFSVNGDQVVEKVKQLIKEDNVRRVIIKNENHGIPRHCRRGRRIITTDTCSTQRGDGVDGAVHDRGRATGLNNGRLYKI